MPPAFLRPHCLIRCPAPPFPHIRLPPSSLSRSVTYERYQDHARTITKFMLEINNPGFRGSRWIQFQKCSSHGSSATSSTICKAGPSRRDVALLGCCYWASTAIVSSPGLHAATELDGDVKMALFVDDINAYSFLYPTELPGKKFSFKWVESRKPERYSSAAPLSPDARQRIVSERVDMINNLIISISIGPPNLGYLTSTDKKTWQAKDVADSVLSDKSALPVKTSQRRTESSVINAHANEVDGDVYWYYEYLVRKSPTKSVQESNIYRHNVASTAERDGYLYSFNASTLSKKWESLGPFLEKAVSSFRLLPPTEYYVPPFKDPWRFW